MDVRKLHFILLAKSEGLENEGTMVTAEKIKRQKIFINHC